MNFEEQLKWMENEYIPACKKAGKCVPFELSVAGRVMKRSDFPKPRKKVGRAELYAKQDVEKFLGVK